MVFFKFIQTATTGVFQTFGRCTGTVGPGLQFYIPIVQKITPVSNRLRQETFKFETKTKDNVFVKLGLAVQYQIKPEDTEKAFFSLNRPIDQIDSYIENVVRARVPKMKLDELFESQDDICHSVATELSEKMIKHGYAIENTLVTDIDPAQDVKEAMNRINAAERLKEAAINEAEAHYIKEVKQAEADRDRKRLQGEGISQQRLAILEGYETGVDNMAKRFGLSSREIIDFVREIQELDTMESIGRSPNAKTLFLGRGTNSIRDSLLQANEASESRLLEKE